MNKTTENKEIPDIISKKISDQDMAQVAGGEGGYGYNLTVGDCNGNYLALRPQPV